MDMSDVYRRFLNDELALQEAAQLLRMHASAWKAEPGSLRLDTLPEEQREKAAELFNAAIQPILDPYFAGQVASDATARQLAPLVRPMGVYALNLNMPPGSGADEAMGRLIELTNRLADLESENDELQ
jgi:hypothetical protein